MVLTQILFSAFKLTASHATSKPLSAYIYFAQAPA